MSRQTSAGSFGEELTAQKLQSDGWEILERNWHSKNGELDIVARRGNMLTFVEVKARTAGAIVSGAEAVTRAKMVKLVKAAMDYIYKFDVNVNETYLRFDIAEVTLERCAEPKLISFRYIEDAFSPSSVGIYL
ncbi:MAG: YraN family protein [Oscillospiraceae bacterium]|nr:YraN family protein [Oscillospiraceae bacterium]